MISLSWHRAYVCGTGTDVCSSAEITLYSRLMSWAVARTWPSGGRRTASLRSALLTMYVRLDLPPVIRLASSVPGRRRGPAASIHRPKASKSSPSMPELGGPELGGPELGGPELGGPEPSGSVPMASVLRSTGDVNDLSGYEAGAAADQEGSGISDVFWLPDALHRDLLGRVFDEFVEVDANALGGSGRHIRLNEARGNDVCRNTELT